MGKKATRKFTDSYIRNLKPRERTYEIFESGQHGFGSFGIRVTYAGTKSWIFSYRFNGKCKRYLFGRYPDVSLKEAREQARICSKLVMDGRDPARERQELKESETMNDLWESYVNSPDAKKKASFPEEQRKYEKHIKDSLGSMKLKVITRRDVAKVINDLALASPVSANRLHSLLSMLFNRAVSDGLISSSPMAGMKKPAKERARERVLSPDEVRTLWPLLPGYYKLMLLTGCRPSEAYGIHSDELDRKTGVWTIPASRTKTGKPNPLPLSDMALELLPENVSGYFFPAPRAGGPVKHPKSVINRIRRQSGIDDWTPHILRKTARSLMAEASVPFDIAELILGHSLGKIPETYMQYDLVERKRDALTALAAKVSEIIGLQSKRLQMIKKIQSVLKAKTDEELEEIVDFIKKQNRRGLRVIHRA